MMEKELAEIWYLMILLMTNPNDMEKMTKDHYRSSSPDKSKGTKTKDDEI